MKKPRRNGASSRPLEGAARPIAATSDYPAAAAVRKAPHRLGNVLDEFDGSAEVQIVSVSTLFCHGSPVFKRRDDAGHRGRCCRKKLVGDRLGRFGCVLPSVGAGPLRVRRPARPGGAESSYCDFKLVTWQQAGAR
jgi:hypothetical protein